MLMVENNFWRKIIYSSFIFLLSILLVFSPTMPALATVQSPQREVYAQNNIRYYDSTEVSKNSGCVTSSGGGSTSSGGSKPSGNQITWIGDSYSVGAQSIIQSKLPGVDLHIESGKWFYYNGASNPGGNGGVAILQDLVSSNNLRDYLVFALGTNGGMSNWGSTDYFQQVVDLAGSNTKIIFTTLRTLNGDNNSSTGEMYRNFNSALLNFASSHNNVFVADWDATVGDDIYTYYSNADGIHPKDSTAYTAWVNTIIGALPGGAGTVAGNGLAEKVWNYFATANIPGVSDDPAVIAGIMGNLKSESELNPFAHDSGSRYYGIYQTDDQKLIGAVNNAGLGSYWGSSSAPDSAIDQALQIELDYLTQKNDRFLGTGWAQKFGFLVNINNTTAHTPEAYADLFVMAVEGAVTSATTWKCNGRTGTSTYIEDAGVRSIGHANFSGANGGGERYQGAECRRDNARSFYDSYAGSAQTYIKTATTASFTAQESTTYVNTDEYGDSSRWSHWTGICADLDDTRRSFLESQNEAIRSAAASYGIPWEIIAAQALWESGGAVSPLAVSCNNPLGLKTNHDCEIDHEHAKFNSLEEAYESYATSVIAIKKALENGYNYGPYSLLEYIEYGSGAPYAQCSQKNIDEHSYNGICDGYSVGDPTRNYVEGVSELICGVQKWALANGITISAENFATFNSPYIGERTDGTVSDSDTYGSYDDQSGNTTGYCDDTTSGGGSEGTTEVDINGYTYVFPIAGATKENYLNNTAEHPSILSSKANGWYHHDYPAVDMGIYYKMITGRDFDPGDYPQWHTSSNLAQCSATYGIIHCNSSTGAPVVALTDGTITYYNHYGNGLTSEDTQLCAQTSLQSVDGNRYIYLHLGYEDQYTSLVGQTVTAGTVIGHVGISPCAQYTQAHVHIQTSDKSNSIKSIIDQLYDALPENAAEAAQRENSNGGGSQSGDSAKPIEPLSSSSESISCAQGTTDLGVDTQAYISGTPISIRLCSIPTITQSDNSDNHIHVNSRVSGAFYALGQRYYEQKGSYLSASESFRTMAQQEYFWNCFQTKSCNGGNRAAQPGYSNHQSGLAVDLNVGGWSSAISQWLKNNLPDFGLNRGVSDEPWHVSPSGN